MNQQHQRTLPLHPLQCVEKEKGLNPYLTESVRIDKDIVVGPEDVEND